MSRSALSAVLLSCVCSAASAQELKSLAYVRTVVAVPVRVHLPTQTEPASQPRWVPGARPNKKAEQELRQHRDALRASAPQVVQAALPEVMTRFGGITAFRTLDKDTPDTSPELGALARQANTDAGLAVTVDRCGLHVGIEREVWIRVAGRIETARSEAFGPLYGVGWARSSRKLLGRGFSRTDAELLDQAARQALAQMARQVRTGIRPPFAGGGRYLVVRAAAPEEIVKTETVGKARPQSVKIEVPTLYRQSDVLFQPDLPPVLDVIDTDEGDKALKGAGLAQRDLWNTAGTPAKEVIKELAGRVKADFVFLSRVREVALEELPIELLDGKTQRLGVQRNVGVTVVGALYSVRDDRILWQDVVEGGTIARTEYVRGKPRIRTDDQAVMDATHTAYAYLRYSFDEFHRRYSR
jgi:hypothetical protein